MIESTHWMVEAWQPDGWVRPQLPTRYGPRTAPANKWVRPATYDKKVVCRIIKDKRGQARTQATHAEKLGLTVVFTPMNMIPTEEYERLLEQRKRPKTDIIAWLESTRDTIYDIVPEAAIHDS